MQKHLQNDRWRTELEAAINNSFTKYSSLPIKPHCIFLIEQHLYLRFKPFSLTSGYPKLASLLHTVY